MIKKTPKPKDCPCGKRFTPTRISKYCSVKCELDFKTGRAGEPTINMPLQTLREMAKGMFCQFIKLRDSDKPEITSGKMEGKGEVMTAGHLYPCNQFPGLMFNEDNCFKQSDFNNLNMCEHSVYWQTTANVVERIGVERFNELSRLSALNSIKNYKWSAIEYIEKYHEYKEKVEELKQNARTKANT